MSNSNDVVIIEKNSCKAKCFSSTQYIELCSYFNSLSVFFCSFLLYLAWQLVYNANAKSITRIFKSSLLKNKWKVSRLGILYYYVLKLKLLCYATRWRSHMNNARCCSNSRPSSTRLQKETNPID